MPSGASCASAPAWCWTSSINFLHPHGFRFGPDVATSSRATLGGMIANDSSGALHPGLWHHRPACPVARSDHWPTANTPGSAPSEPALQQQRQLLDDLVMLNSLHIAERFPAGPAQTLAGLRAWRGPWTSPDNLVPILCGSEGTLAGIFSAELKVVPLPAERGVGLIFFDSVAEAMQATEALLDLQPAAIEHVDRPLFDQTRGQREFQAVRALLDLDAQPCAAILIVEFFADAQDKLAQMEQRQPGPAPVAPEKRPRTEPGLGHAQSRAVAAHQLQGRGQAGVLRRGCGRAPAGPARLRRRAGELDGARRRGGVLLRACGGRFVARAAGAGPAQPGGPEEVPADCR